MILTLLTNLILAPQTDYLAEESKWRAARQERLLAERGWLTLAGLFWLKEGENSIGSSDQSSVKLPASAPAILGKLNRKGESVSFEPEQSAEFLLNGKAGQKGSLKSDAGGPNDKVKVGSVTFAVIKRGARIGVRVWDNNAPEKTNFKGLNWFPVDPKLRIVADFVPYNPPKKLSITNILGDTGDVSSAGYVTFTLNGKRYRLETEDEGDTYFINFKDGTNGKETYGASRFLDIEKPVGGKAILDFNRAYNPPCCYSPFATCPLPPKANFLKTRILAGEKLYHPTSFKH